MQKIKQLLRVFSLLAFVLFLSMSMPGCAKVKRVVMGDPRKNVNHPKHGDYVREQRMKKNGY